METKRLHIGKSGELDVEFVNSEALERYDALAREALDECRKSIMMALRYLNAAVWQLPPERAPLARPLATNGLVLRFDPERVIERYKSSDAELVRDVLHSVLHCLFHHPFETRHDEYEAWSLACDIAVELAAIELAGNRFPSSYDEARVDAAARLSQIARALTAPALYQVLRSGGPGEALYLDNGLTSREVDALSALFKRDAHELWAVHPRFDDPPAANAQRTEEVPDLQDGGGSASSQSMPEAGIAGAPESSDQREAEAEQHDHDPDEGQAGQASKPESHPDDQAERDESLGEAQEEWEKISKRVEAEMQAQQHSIGGNGSLLQNLTVANRKPANYDEFLQRFATIAEDMRVSDDEFDYVYYTYGLARYGNIPLVEPLEYQESRRVREFVIALDTSGSCSGDLIRVFVERTYDILRRKTAFGDNLNVHIVQCDNRVRTATKVTSLAQIEEYAASYWVSGGGGTDFKPVFEYVDSLLEAGEFSDLRGLIYFTDGYGAFPTKAPDYDVAFVFVNEEDTSMKVPGWACKVIMTQEEVMTR